MKVQLVAFTGMVIGEFEATHIEAANGYELTLSDGRLVAFDGETLKQVNAPKPQFANRIRILETPKQFPTLMKNMTKHQRIAANQVKFALEQIVGDYENSISDGHIEYMPSHDELADEIYDGVMNNSYGKGVCHYGHPFDEVRFAGAEFIKNYINNRLVMEGY